MCIEEYIACCTWLHAREMRAEEAASLDDYRAQDHEVDANDNVTCYFTLIFLFMSLILAMILSVEGRSAAGLSGAFIPSKNVAL
jgi:hypothetical protein